MITNVKTEGLRPLRLGSIRGLMEQANAKCYGGHDVYVADVIIVPSEGTVTTITVCRSCDRVTYHKEQIAAANSNIESKNEMKTKG